MKKILSSTIQIFKQIKSDPMMFAACFSPFIMGTLIKFGIPFLERITKFSLQAYYPIFDLLLSIMAPVLLCFAFAMITVYLIIKEKNYIISLIPGMFYSFVIFSYIFNAQIGFNLNINISYVLAAIFTVLYAILTVRSGRKLKSKADTKLAD